MIKKLLDLIKALVDNDGFPAEFKMNTILGKAKELGMEDELWEFLSWFNEDEDDFEDEDDED